MQCCYHNFAVAKTILVLVSKSARTFFITALSNRKQYGTTGKDMGELQKYRQQPF